MSSLVEYQCPNCGGAIRFDAAAQSFRCDSCGNVYTEAQLAGYDEAIKNAEKASHYDWHSDGAEEELEGMKKYSCESCGAEIIADDTTAASECPYCGNPIMMTGNLTGMSRPSRIIPFKLTQKQAMESLRSFCKGKKLLPKGFLSENRVKEIKGLYVPFWLFDCDANASIVYDATRVRTWSDSKYNYTETSHYDIYRSGSIGFADIPVDGSKKMDDTYMDGIEPFNYAEMREFNPAFLSGFVADKYDVSAEECFNRAEERVRKSTEDSFASTVNGYSTVIPKSTSIRTNNSSYKYAMMPVWMLNTKYRDKLYTFAVNGQTGRVSGTLPVDRTKFWLWFGGIAAAIIAVAQIFIF
ncbi:MAG: hypothetical protein K6F09_02805 [Clostridiales bacterium]|nr:hypothetical protein [Clostridiales bacterium]